ncbi:16230_t:CDS:2, partial [Racocetra persica]
RVQSAECALKILNRKKKENEENFRKNDNYKAFHKFAIVLQKIKKFIMDVGQLLTFRGIFEADKKEHAKSIEELQKLQIDFNTNVVSEKLKKLTDEFDNVMDSLQFANIPFSKKQSETPENSVDIELGEMVKFLNEIENFFDKNSQALKELLVINDNDKIRNEIEPPQINSRELKELNESNSLQPDNRQGIFRKFVPSKNKGVDQGKIIKRRYRNDVVVCLKKCSKDDLRQLKIRERLNKLPSILQFYGTYSEYMVLEFAERESLEEIINGSRGIPWQIKILIALEICRGIIFLHSVRTFHYDIRCKNIMITDKLMPKITNFQCEGSEREFNWMAPESQENNNQELEIQKELEVIIKKTWHHEPEMRISISELFLGLSELNKKYPNEIKDLPDKKENIKEGDKSKENSSLKLVTQLEEGIKLINSDSD